MLNHSSLCLYILRVRNAFANAFNSTRWEIYRVVSTQKHFEPRTNYRWERTKKIMFTVAPQPYGLKKNKNDEVALWWYLCGYWARTLLTRMDDDRVVLWCCVFVGHICDEEEDALAEVWTFCARSLREDARKKFKCGICSWCT